MAKRSLFPGAFALPGLATDKRDSSVARLTASRSDAERNSVDIETRKTPKTYKNDSTVLVDENGEFLSQQTEVSTLKHLTKSRPRSPARRPTHQSRERSRSPENANDVFEHYSGIKHDTQSPKTEDKQHDESHRNSRSRINKNTNKPITQHEDEAQQQIVRHSNTAIITNYHYPTGVTKLNHSPHSEDANLDLDMSRHDYNSDDDLVDMLIADYEDSDDSDSDDKPPLPSSPPIDLEGKSLDTSSTTRASNTTLSNEIKTTSKLFPNLRNNNENSNNTNTNITSHTTKLFPSISTTAGDDIPSDIKNKDISINLPTTKSTTALPGNTYTSQSSARRRRFKPVSIDNVEQSDETEKLSHNDSMNRTFPRSRFDNSDSIGKSRKEVDWGLRTGTLNSSFTESTLKSGTMFDKFLQRDAKIANVNEAVKENIHNLHDTDLQPDNMRTRNSMSYSNHGEDELKSSTMEHKTEMTQNRNGEIPTIQVHAPDESSYNTAKKSLSTLFSLESGSEDDDDDIEDDDGSDIDDIIENVPDTSGDNNESTLNHYDSNENTLSYDIGDDHYDHNGDDDDDNDRTLSLKKYDAPDDDDYDDENERTISYNEYDIYHDGDDEDDDDYSYETSGYSPSFLSDSKDVATSKLRTTPNTLTVDGNDDITNITDMDDDLIASSDEEIVLNDSLSSVVDTHDNTMYSPGEIPGLQYRNQVDSTDLREELYSPPQWENDEDEGDQYHVDDDVDDDDINSTDREQQCEEMKYLSDEDDCEDAESNNEVFPVDDGIQPPEIFDEDLFEPPAMFASDEETEHENEDQDFVDVLPPLPLSPVQNKKVMPFHKIPLLEWTEEDALEWLQYVGLGHFKEQFKAHCVNGRTLKNINFQLLEEIGISAPDERELLLAEIYELDNPSEEEHLEAEIQDALETASEQDKEKILAVLTALRSPTLSQSMEFPAVHDNEVDSDQGYHLSSDTGSITSSVAASDDHRDSTNITPSQSEHSDLHLHGGISHEQTDRKAVNEQSKKPGKDKADKKKSKEKNKKKNKGSKKEKKSFSKFWESLSISHTSSKLTKVFGSKKFNPAMQYLLQAGPQGILRVWPTSLSGQTKYCSFMVSMTTTSTQVVRMVLEKYDAVVADPLRYYLCEVGLGKGAHTQVLKDHDCPLTWQCRWSDPEKFHFEMRCRDEGSVRMLFEMDGYEGDLDYRSIAVSTKTPCKDVIPLIVKKYDLPGKPDDYQLMEVSEDNEDDRRVVRDHVCPLQLQKAWNEPDHVFRLVRKHVTPPTVQPQRAPVLSTENQELISDLPRLQSDVSSLPDGYETDSTDHPDNTSEEADLPPISKELEVVVLEVQDSLASQQSTLLTSARNENLTTAINRESTGTKSEVLDATIEKHLEEMKKKNEELERKDKEIDDLKKERDALLEKEKELMVWRIRNEELVKREEDMEKIQESMIEMDEELAHKNNQMEELQKERDELLEKESELLVWRMRNDELVKREQEIEALQNSLQEKEVDDQVLKEGELNDLRIQYSGLTVKYNESKSLEQKLTKTLDDLRGSLQNKDSVINQRDQEIERLYQRHNELISKEKEVQELRDQLEEFSDLESELERIKNESTEAINSRYEELETKVQNLQYENDSLQTQLREAKLLTQNSSRSHEEYEKLNLKLEVAENENRQLARKSEDLQRRNHLLEKSAKLLDSLRQENQTLLAKTKDMDDMKRNIIKLTSQLREADNLRLNQGELDDLKLRLSISEAEKQQVQTRLDEAERRNMALREDLKDNERLRNEHKMLQAKVSELEREQRQAESMRSEIKENEVMRQKLKKATDLELALKKELAIKGSILKQKDGKIEEMDKKIKAMTEAMKKMEAKFRDHNEQRENLSRLLTVIKDKDPSLLRTLHKSISTSSDDNGIEEENEEEEWC